MKKKCRSVLLSIGIEPLSLFPFLAPTNPVTHLWSATAILFRSKGCTTLAGGASKAHQTVQRCFKLVAASPSPYWPLPRAMTGGLAWRGRTVMLRLYPDSSTLDRKEKSLQPISLPYPRQAAGMPASGTVFVHLVIYPPMRVFPVRITPRSTVRPMVPVVSLESDHEPTHETLSLPSLAQANYNLVFLFLA